MERITLKRSNQRPIVFEGKLLASYETSPDRSRGNWSGSNGRWEEVKVYRSKSGRYILRRALLTQWEGENDRFEAVSFGSAEALVDYLEEESPRAAGEIAQELGVGEEA